jgi:hypothetical protein
MPSFVAHLLISKEVFSALDIPKIKGSQNYFLLGSLGPDLPYYRNVFGTAISTFFEEKYNPDSPGFYSGDGDYFHSRTPNLFPMKMIEVVRKDKDSNTESQKLAFTLGYLTHVASDQHIHPFVEKFSGPFYLSGKSRQKHRILEVYQDLFLFKEKYPDNNFFEEDFQSWIDIGPPVKEEEEQVGGAQGSDLMKDLEKKYPTKIYTYEWFRSFIQRAFLETYSLIIDGDEIEKWTKGFASIFKPMENIGPYRDAYKNIMEVSREAEAFREMFYGEETNYLSKCFVPAKQLAEKYILVANKFFSSKYISDIERKQFLSQIHDADLTSPLVDI